MYITCAIKFQPAAISISWRNVVNIPNVSFTFVKSVLKVLMVLYVVVCQTLKAWKSPQWVSFSTFLLCAILLLIASGCVSLLPLLPLVLICFLLLNALFIFFFQVPFASFPSAPVLLASTLSSPVTRRTCTACRMTSVTAMAGLCFAPGEALASPSFLASSAPWPPPFNQYPDPPAPSPDRRMAPSAKPYGCKKTDWTHRLTTNKQKKTCDRFIYPLITWLQFSICVLKKSVS